MELKVFKIIILLVVLSSCTPLKEINKEPITTSTKIINCNGYGELVFGMTLSEIQNKFPSYTMKEYPEFWGYTFTDTLKNENLFLTIIDDTLTGISFANRIFSLENGLKPGDNILKFKNLYPTIPILYNFHDDVEEFELIDSNCVINIELHSNKKNKLLGKYNNKNIHDIAYKYSTNGYIEIISIYKK